MFFWSVSRRRSRYRYRSLRSSDAVAVSSSGKGGVRLAFRIASDSPSSSMPPVGIDVFSEPLGRFNTFPSTSTTYSLPIERARSIISPSSCSGRKTTCVMP